MDVAVVPRPPATRGTRFQAGMGWSTVIPEIDFETFSTAGYVPQFYLHADKKGKQTLMVKWACLPGAPNDDKGLGVVGAANYARHPSTRILCCAYDLKDGYGWRHWRPGCPPPTDLFAYLATGGPIEAWNVGFERWIWLYTARRLYGWPDVRPEQWRCAMAKSRAHALPGRLDLAGAVLNLATQKDKGGKEQLDRFSVPRNSTIADQRPWILPEEDPPNALKLFDYNHTDIVSESEASQLIPDLEGEELLWWQLDQTINVRGAPVDRVGVLDCIEIVKQCLVKYDRELLELTGIDAASKVKQLTEWLHAHGCPIPNMKADTVEKALERQLTDKAEGKSLEELFAEGWTEWGLVQTGRMIVPTAGILDPRCRRVLELRALCGSASVKKAFAMLHRLTDDDRMHDLYNYHGARTGRPTGEGPQPTNLPKAGPDVYECSSCRRHFGKHLFVCCWCGTPIKPGQKGAGWSPEAAVDALLVISRRSIDYLEWVFGDALLTVAGCLRALYKARPGYEFISSDYSAIEAVVIAVIAGEQWRIDVFRTHGKIYEESAARAYGLSFNEVMRHRGWTDEQLATPKWWEVYDEPRGKHHPLRAKGKILELACGFQGGVGSMKAFGAPGSDEELQEGVTKWRFASPTIEWLWGGQTKGKAARIRRDGTDTWDKSPMMFGVEGAALSAVLQPGVEFPVNRMDGTFTGVTYVARSGSQHGTITLYACLPSGRYLTYHNATVQPQEEAWRGLGLMFWGYNTNPKNGPVGRWIQMRTWGGRLVENLVQAIARDIFRHCLLNLEAVGYPIVLHTYDEPVAEVPVGVGSIEHFETIMNIMPAFAQGWPVKAAGGWRADRYRKDG